MAKASSTVTPESKEPVKASRDCRRFSLRILWPMTPVDKTRMSSGWMERWLARAEAESCASTRPAGPVAAFAWPAFVKT